MEYGKSAIAAFAFSLLLTTLGILAFAFNLTRRIWIMKYGKTAIAAFALSLFLASLGACQKPEGPAEHAGKEFDKAVDKAGQQIEKAGNAIQDGAKGEKKQP